MKSGFTAVVLGVSLLCGPPVALADAYRYFDERGEVHYVDSPDKVPAQYQSEKLDAQSNKVSRGGSATYMPRPKSDESLQNTAKKQKVEIFVTSWCPHCRELETFLDAKKISYSRYDVERDAKGRKKYQSLGGGGVPLIKIGPQIIRGFSEQTVTQALHSRS